MNILVAVDLSDCTNEVADRAMALAKGLAAKVWLLHVAEPEPDFVGYDVGPQNERDALSAHFHEEHTAIQAIGDDFREEGLDATALLIRGPTAEVILREAERLEADILIVGSHGRGAMHRLLVGSISEEVMRHAKCPIFVVPTHKRD